MLVNEQLGDPSVVRDDGCDESQSSSCFGARRRGCEGPNTQHHEREREEEEEGDEGEILAEGAEPRLEVG